MAPSVLSALYSSVLPTYVTSLKQGHSEEDSLDLALAQVNNVSKKRLLGNLASTKELLFSLEPAHGEAKTNPFMEMMTAEMQRSVQEVHLKGFNSDVIGFTRSIEPLLEPIHRKALILGTGGASKAVRYGLHRLGIETRFVSRNPKEDSLTYPQLTPEIMDEYKVIVNCTPVGMYPHTEECPALPYAAIGRNHLLYDLVYNPEETLFLRKGREQDAITKNGLEMLILQAYAGWEFWHSED